jgi:hypothetical protein
MAADLSCYVRVCLRRNRHQHRDSTDKANASNHFLKRQSLPWSG